MKKEFCKFLLLIAASCVAQTVDALPAVNFFWPPTNSASPATFDVQPGEAIPFTNAVGSVNGDAAAYPIVTPNSGKVTISTAGTYLISYHITSQDANPFSVGLRYTIPSELPTFIQGSIVLATPLTTGGGNLLHFNVNGQVVVALVAGSTLELINSDSGSDNIQLLSYSTTVTQTVPSGISAGAFLNIVQLE